MHYGFPIKTLGNDCGEHLEMAVKTARQWLRFLGAAILATNAVTPPENSSSIARPNMALLWDSKISKYSPAITNTIPAIIDCFG